MLLHCPLFRENRHTTEAHTRCKSIIEFFIDLCVPDNFLQKLAVTTTLQFCLRYRCIPKNFSSSLLCSDVVLQTQVLVSRRLEKSRDSVLMSWSRSWSWDTKSWSWSRLGPFKPWYLVSEVQNHVRNYDFSEKGHFPLKKPYFQGFWGYTQAAIQYFFVLFAATRDIT